MCCLLMYHSAIASVSNDEKYKAVTDKDGVIEIEWQVERDWNWQSERERRRSKEGCKVTKEIDFWTPTWRQTSHAATPASFRPSVALSLLLRFSLSFHISLSFSLCPMHNASLLTFTFMMFAPGPESEERKNEGNQCEGEILPKPPQQGSCSLKSPWI